MSDELTTLITFGSPEEAALARARLAQAGISCVLSDEHFSSAQGDVLAGGVTLQVAPEDASLAQKILEEDYE